MPKASLAKTKTACKTEKNCQQKGEKNLKEIPRKRSLNTNGICTAIELEMARVVHHFVVFTVLMHLTQDVSK